MGELLYSASSQGDQTLHRGKIVWFLKSFIFSRMNQGFLLRQESSLFPKVEYQQS